jgi:hypothetical protein
MAGILTTLKTEIRALLFEAILYLAGKGAVAIAATVAITLPEDIKDIGKLAIVF